jgi:hypothetical protein
MKEAAEANGAAIARINEARRNWLLKHTEADIRARVRQALGISPWDYSMYSAISQ